MAGTDRQSYNHGDRDANLGHWGSFTIQRPPLTGGCSDEASLMVIWTHQVQSIINNPLLLCFGSGRFHPEGKT